MTGTGVKTCRIPGAILYHPGLSLPEKVFLGLVWSFPAGLKLNNAEIGRIVCLHPVNVSLMISRLEAGGLLEIKAKQSRWRKIYFSAGVKVKIDSTLAFDDSTLAQALIYFSAGAKQNRKKKIEGKTDFHFSDVDPIETTSETPLESVSESEPEAPLKPTPETHNPYLTALDGQVEKSLPNTKTTPEPVPPSEPDKPTLESLKAQADPAMGERVLESLGFAEGLAL